MTNQKYYFQRSEIRTEIIQNPLLLLHGELDYVNKQFLLGGMPHKMGGT